MVVGEKFDPFGIFEGIILSCFLGLTPRGYRLSPFWGWKRFWWAKSPPNYLKNDKAAGAGWNWGEELDRGGIISIFTNLVGAE